MAKFIIYMATNENGKSYIGLTSKPLEKRRKSHENTAKGKKVKYIFHKALKKYTFKWKIIDHARTLNSANKKEAYYIKKFGTKLPNGYNMTDGGDGGKGYKVSNKTKKQMSKRLKKEIKDPESYSYKMIENNKVKIRADDGIIYNSIKEASKATGINPQLIQGVVSGKTKVTKGRYFEPVDKDLKDSQIKRRKELELSWNNRYSSVIDGEGNIYKSTEEVLEKFKLTRYRFSKIIKGYERYEYEPILKYHKQSYKKDGRYGYRNKKSCK